MPRFQVSSGPVALAASTTKTIIDLATPAGSIASIAKVRVGSDATSAGTATSALRVQVGLFSAAVTTHTAYTPGLWDYGGNGIASAITAGIATTSEGAGTAVASQIEEFPLPLTQSDTAVWETVLRVIPASSFWRIRLISPANINTTNVYATVSWDE